MKLAKMFSVVLAALLGTTLVFTACKEDDNNPSSTGQLSIEMTDGPIDDASVKGAFVTVAQVQVDGQAFSGFSGKKTINLMDYQQGNVAALGLGSLEAGSYQNITLVLDHQTDASGNTPGTYVLTTDNVKHSLSALATQSFTLAKNFTIESGQKTEMVVDFDLHKAIEYQNSASDKYNFVAAADLQSAMRLVVKENTAEIKGTTQNTLVATDKIVVYAYKKGQFNRTAEMSAQNGVAFKNAVASTTVASNGNFVLAFMEEGEYELHFAAYKDLNSDGKLDLQGTLLLNSVVNLDALRIVADTDVQLTVLVTGILP